MSGSFHLTDADLQGFLREGEKSSPASTHPPRKYKYQKALSWSRKRAFLNLRSARVGRKLRQGLRTQKRDLSVLESKGDQKKEVLDSR